MSKLSPTSKSPERETDPVWKICLIPIRTHVVAQKREIVRQRDTERYRETERDRETEPERQR